MFWAIQRTKDPFWNNIPFGRVIEKRWCHFPLKSTESMENTIYQLSSKNKFSPNNDDCSLFYHKNSRLLTFFDFKVLAICGELTKFQKLIHLPWAYNQKSLFFRWNLTSSCKKLKIFTKKVWKIHFFGLFEKCCGITNIFASKFIYDWKMIELLFQYIQWNFNSDNFSTASEVLRSRNGGKWILISDFILIIWVVW